MSEPKKSAKPKAIADVAHPGKSTPSDTSKPIITNRPRMKDPMVVEDNDSPEEAKKSLSKKSRELKLTPVGSEAAKPEPDTDETTAKPAKTDESPAEADESAPKKADEKAADTAAGPKTEAEKDAKPDKSDAPETDEKADADKKPKQPDLEAETAEQAEKDAKLQKIIDSKKYFLPINAVEQRRSKRFVALGIVLALLLAVAWVDIALDAGLVHAGSVKPVTHLFSN